MTKIKIALNIVAVNNGHFIGKSREVFFELLTDHAQRRWTLNLMLKCDLVHFFVLCHTL